MLVLRIQHSDSIFVHITNDHHNKSSCHLSPYKMITISSPIVPTLDFSSPSSFIFFFVTGSLYLLISFTYFTHSLDLSSGSHLIFLCIYEASLISSVGKESACNAGDLGSIPGLGWSPGEGKGYPFQYSVLENSMNCIVREVAKSPTQLNDFHLSLFHMSLFVMLICFVF